MNVQGVLPYTLRMFQRDIVAAGFGNPEAYRDVGNHSKWIVVTTVNHPTEQTISLSQLKDWKMVVVGDRKTPSDWA